MDGCQLYDGLAASGAERLKPLAYRIGHRLNWSRSSVTPRGDGRELDRKVEMHTKEEFEGWIAAMSRGDCGFIYVKLYADAPQWVRDMAVNRFGKGTVFLPPADHRPCAA